uniref:EF-hand domain-containing protein n=1 Tax=Strigamia maritima TaxID=126957 RepID=T1IY92_STRMM
MSTYVVICLPLLFTILFPYVNSSCCPQNILHYCPDCYEPTERYECCGKAPCNFFCCGCECREVNNCNITCAFSLGRSQLHPERKDLWYGKSAGHSAEEVMAQLDQDGDESISIEEMDAWFIPRRNMSKEILRQKFNELDTNHNKKLNVIEINSLPAFSGRSRHKRTAKKLTEMPLSDMPLTEKPLTEKPLTEKPLTEKPLTEKPLTEKPLTEKPLTEKPLTEKPLTEKPLTEKPLTEKPLTEKPLTEKPLTEKSLTEKPLTEKPLTEKPLTEKPLSEKPLSDMPLTEKPLTEKSLTEMPLTEKPLTEMPLTEKSETINSLPTFSGRSRQKRTAEKLTEKPLTEELETIIEKITIKPLTSEEEATVVKAMTKLFEIFNQLVTDATDIVLKRFSINAVSLFMVASKHTRHMCYVEVVITNSKNESLEFQVPTEKTTVNCLHGKEASFDIRIRMIHYGQTHVFSIPYQSSYWITEINFLARGYEDVQLRELCFVLDAKATGKSRRKTICLNAKFFQICVDLGHEKFELIISKGDVKLSYQEGVEGFKITELEEYLDYFDQCMINSTIECMHAMCQLIMVVPSRDNNTLSTENSTSSSLQAHKCPVGTIGCPDATWQEEFLIPGLVDINDPNCLVYENIQHVSNDVQPWS